MEEKKQIDGRQTLEQYEYLAAKKYIKNGKVCLSFLPKEMMKKQNSKSGYGRSC